MATYDLEGEDDIDLDDQGRSSILLLDGVDTVVVFDDYLVAGNNIKHFGEDNLGIFDFGRTSIISIDEGDSLVIDDEGHSDNHLFAEEDTLEIEDDYGIGLDITIAGEDTLSVSDYGGPTFDYDEEDTLSITDSGVRITDDGVDTLVLDDDGMMERTINGIDTLDINDTYGRTGSINLTGEDDLVLQDAGSGYFLDVTKIYKPL